MKVNILLLILTTLSISTDHFAQELDSDISADHILSKSQLESLFTKPNCLKGYHPNQAGYLSKSDSRGTEALDTTFTIEPIQIHSGPIIIHGWLYLPLGTNRHPLIVLTNGGGNDAQIRTFPDWIAPILAHCGIAAFVHDKRGTGKSEGVFKETVYDDYITDAGNCARYFANHPRVDPGSIGVLGGSEGGRIAVLAACRFPEIRFAISYAGTVVNPIEDRLYAQRGWLRTMNLTDSVFQEAWEIHEKSIRAWASKDPDRHAIVDQEIMALREKYEREILPSTKDEMDHRPELEYILPTWNSLPNDYLTELKSFNKEWLAIFGELDQRVPTRQSVTNIKHYMAVSRNENYWIAVIPDCGHAPINLKTQRMVRLDHLVINWIEPHIL